MTTEQQKLFVRVMTSLFQVQQSVADLFFKNRLNEETQNILEKHIQFQTRPLEEIRPEYIRSLKNLVKVLQEIAYLEKGEAVQLALSQEQVLRYLHNIIKGMRNIKQIPAKTEATIKPIGLALQPLVVQPAVQIVQRRHRSRKELSETQEKILEFVRQIPDRRTKDVVNQFSALSPRTVKRGLKELSEDGRIVKRIESGAVYYSVV